MSMRDENAGPAAGILLIGCGNTLRGDDAAGYLVAESFRCLDVGSIRARAVHQLTPELAADIAGCSEVIFVDAYPAREGDSLRIMNLQPEPQPTRGPLGHHLDPAALLSMAQRLYDYCPDAWVIGIPAQSFDHPDTLTPTTQRFMEMAMVWLREHFQAEAGA